MNPSAIMPPAFCIPGTRHRARPRALRESAEWMDDAFLLCFFATCSSPADILCDQGWAVEIEFQLQHLDSVTLRVGVLPRSGVINADGLRLMLVQLRIF